MTKWTSTRFYSRASCERDRVVTVQMIVAAVEASNSPPKLPQQALIRVQVAVAFGEQSREGSKSCRPTQEGIEWTRLFSQKSCKPISRQGSES